VLSRLLCSEKVLGAAGNHRGGGWRKIGVWGALMEGCETKPARLLSAGGGVISIPTAKMS